jgi:hypothetical protein
MCVCIYLWYVYSVVVAWGVFLPQLGKEKGVGNRYIPLRSLRVSTCEVTTIHTDNSSGLLCAADARGNVCVWEVFEDNKHASTSSGSSTSRSTSSPPKQTHTGDAAGAASTAGTSAGQCTGACQHLRVKKTSAQFRSAVSAASAVSGVDASEDVGAEEEDIEASFVPNNIREVRICFVVCCGVCGSVCHPVLGPLYFQVCEVDRK